jgi:hypothetical protein
MVMAWLKGLSSGLSLTSAGRENTVSYAASWIFLRLVFFGQLR